MAIVRVTQTRKLPPANLVGGQRPGHANQPRLWASARGKGAGSQPDAAAVAAIASVGAVAGLSICCRGRLAEQPAVSE